MAGVDVQFGGKDGRRFRLETNDDLVAIRTRDRGPVEGARLSGASRQLLDGLELVTEFRDAGVEVFHVRDGSTRTRDAVRETFTHEPAIRFAGRVLSDPAYRPGVAVAAVTPGAATMKEPVLYTENLFVKFVPGTTSAVARQVLAAAGLSVKRAVGYLVNAYLASAPEGTGLGVFPLALSLLREAPGIEFCHPELIRPRQLRGAFPPQWHLRPARINGERIDAHASVVSAWRRSKGRGVTIAIIDTGIDIDHEEFASAGKIVASHDATAGALDPANPRPQLLGHEKHGTACAGVACANGRKGASGVAPAARLMPIRLMSGLGSQAEADALAWAVDHGADVISCSWGPTDGDWWDSHDPAHRATVPLPDNTRLAIEYALGQGRSGKGCVICWAAGNGNESVDNDGYASHPGVVTVAACNEAGERSVYSDTGAALWCAFPSSDNELAGLHPLPEPPPMGGVWHQLHPRPVTPGIWTTDCSGPQGYNVGGGTEGGDLAGDYTNRFGGTSSAAPGVAGVAALVLAVNPRLRYDEVKDILKRSCDRIDAAGGRYDPLTRHSPLYGYGRVHAARAVALAAPPRRTRKTAASRPRATAARAAARKR
ncbi:MAG: S8 family serine peptidase [Acidobacteria bacterium]|nr:S8 family serine peptidase [Acidobacteriota bacterium]